MSAPSTAIPASAAAERARPASGRWVVALAALYYLLGAFAVTLWLWRDPASRVVAGNPYDTDQFAWFFRYDAAAVAHFRLPALITAGMNAPQGISVMWNTFMLLPGVLLAPVTLLAGPQTSLTVLMTIGFAGSATAMFAVLRRWGASTTAAAFGGLVYGFSPALVHSAAGHYDLEFAVFPPLIVDAALRLVTGRYGTGRAAALRAGAYLGLLATAQLLTAEELLFDAGLAVVVMVAVLAACRPRAVAGCVRGVATGIAAGIGVTAVIAGYPLWVQFFGPVRQHGSPFTPDYFKNDLAGFAQPSSYMFLHTRASAAFAAKFQGQLPEYLAYLGWPLLIVLALVTVRFWRVLAVRVTAVTFVLLAAFSLGGTLLAGGHEHQGVTLPWYWLQTVPVVGSVIPDRFSIVADGAAAALLAFGIDAARRRWSRARWSGALVTCTAVLAVLPLAPRPLPAATAPSLPSGWTAAFAALRLPPGASVLVVPVPTSTFTEPLRWEADTGSPSSMVGGYFMGPAWNGQAYIDGNGLPPEALYLNRLWVRSSHKGSTAAGDPGSARVPTAAQMWGQITQWHPAAVVAVTSGNSVLGRYLTGLLGRPAVTVGNVLGWRLYWRSAGLCQAACVLELGIACAISAAAWVYLLAAHGGYWRTDQRLPRAGGPLDRWADVVAVVPARNEAAVLPVTLPTLLAQDYPGDFRVTLVDDGSSDGTARVAGDVAAGLRPAVPLTVIEGKPKEPGWAGKVWAMARGLAAAPAGTHHTDGADGYVLFTDADIAWAPGTLRGLVTAAEQDNRDLVSQMALLRAETRWERVVVPAFVYFFAQLYPFRRVNSGKAAAAAGGCMLIRRPALAAAGGLAPVSGALIDDVALGKLIRRAGGRCWLGLSTEVVSVRPYPRLADLWHMIARSAYTQLRYSPALLAGTVLGLLLLYAAPPAGAIAGVTALAVHATGAAALAAGTGLAGWLLMTVSYVPMLRFYRLSPLRAPGLPLVALLYAVMTADSARRHYTGKAVSWRGRTADHRAADHSTGDHSTGDHGTGDHTAVGHPTADQRLRFPSMRVPETRLWPPDPDGTPGRELIRRYVVADVFTTTPLEGNQLGVFPDGRGLDTALMQRTARELNFSETVFFIPPDQGGDVRVRIFTPAAELPFAGHPVLGSAFVVGEILGIQTVNLETGSGQVPVELERDGNRITFGRMTQPVPHWEPYTDAAALLAALGVERSVLPVEVYQNGPRHVYVQLDDPDAVAKLTPDMAALGRHELGVSCYARTDGGWKTRMFAPGMGVPEDPATGSAAGPLAVHLARHGQVAFGEEIEVHQGAEIARPSVLYARADRVDRVLVGGCAVIVARGEYRLA